MVLSSKVVASPLPKCAPRAIAASRPLGPGDGEPFSCVCLASPSFMFRLPHSFFFSGFFIRSFFVLCFGGLSLGSPKKGSVRTYARRTQTEAERSSRRLPCCVVRSPPFPSPTPRVHPSMPVTQDTPRALPPFFPRLAILKTRSFFLSWWCDGGGGGGTGPAHRPPPTATDAAAASLTCTARSRWCRAAPGSCTRTCRFLSSVW